MAGPLRRLGGMLLYLVKGEGQAYERVDDLDVRLQAFLAGERRRRGRLPWATLLRRVLAIEMLVCPRCGGPRRTLEAVTEPAAVRRLLVALGLAAQPPPARAVTAS